MIIKDPNFQWIYINPSNPNLPYKTQWDFPTTKEDYLEHWGKWVIMESKETLDALAAKLEPYVEDRSIYSIKYDQTPQEFIGLGDALGMCVFCDDRDRDRVWGILAQEGVTEKAWYYERQTLDMWKPGGMLMEKWIEHYKLSPEKAQKLRDVTQKNYDKMLSSMFDERGKANEDIWNFEQICWQTMVEDKIKTIEKILQIEWNMFSRVQNVGGKASCQEDPKAFEIMRSSQFMTWSNDCLESYLDDLNKALKEGRNLPTEKYARMMRFNAPDEYQKVKEMLPVLDEEILDLVDKIVAIELVWQEEFIDKYPSISGRGRPIYSRDDSPLAVSIETYLRGELETYSLNTLKAYFRDIVDKMSKDINGSELVHEHQVRRYGYGSLDEAEAALGKRAN
ncbi:MAG: DUF4125 family protein [Desulfatiglans sp.]|jgi:hypothetical protein|nr:DUF4125 family protein [Thermodesulfobacteriota bacterium]MEE4354055.1 DUF4125 family protein [Desulfatiglans sp.]